MSTVPGQDSWRDAGLEPVDPLTPRYRWPARPSRSSRTPTGC